MSNPKMSETLHHALDVRVASCHFAYGLQMCISYAPHERASCFDNYTELKLQNLDLHSARTCGLLRYQQTQEIKPKSLRSARTCGLLRRGYSFSVNEYKLTLRTNVRVASHQLSTDSI